MNIALSVLYTKSMPELIVVSLFRRVFSEVFCDSGGIPRPLVVWRRRKRSSPQRFSRDTNGAIWRLL